MLEESLVKTLKTLMGMLMEWGKLVEIRVGTLVGMLIGTLVRALVKVLVRALVVKTQLRIPKDIFGERGLSLL